jgi:hypothetical protein
MNRDLKIIIRLMFAVFCSFLYCACGRQKDSADMTEHIIKVDSPDKIKFSDLFDEYRLIFPELKDSSLFGTEIMMIEKYKDRIYLLNQIQRDKNILCFDTCGKFLFSIDRLGQGPGEYTFLSYFFIDTYLNNIVISSEKNKWLYFDLDGKYLYSKTLPCELKIIDRYTCEFNDSLYISYRDGINEGESEVVFLDKSTLQVKHQVEPVTPFLEDFTPALPVSRDKDIFYYYCCNDVIYDISSDIEHKIPAYYVDFGEKQKEFKSNFLPDNQDEFLSLFSTAYMKNEVTFTRSLFYNGKHMAISYYEFDPDVEIKPQAGISTRYPTVFYDISTRKSYNSKQIDFDIFNSLTVKKMSVLGCFDGYFYAVINDFFDDKEIQTMAKSKYLPEDTKKSLRDFNDESNRIIIVFK